MRFLVSAVLILASFAARAGVDRPYCDFLLLLREVVKQKKVDREIVEALLRTSIDVWDSDPTIRVRERIDVYDQRGPRYVIEKLNGKIWGSTFATKRFANQGDPRRFIKIAGRDLAQFFGYELVADNKIIVPSVRRFMWAIKKINEWNLKERIDVGFFEAESLLTSEEFVRRFGKDGELPISSYLDGEYMNDMNFSHDHTFHTASIFIPSEVMRLARRQMAAVIEFRAFLEKTRPELFMSGLITRYFERHFKRLALALDFGTGNFAANLEHKLIFPTSENALAEAYKFGFTIFATSGISPRKYIEAMADKKLPQVAQIGIWAHDMEPAVFLKKHRKALQEAARNFIETKREDPEFAKGVDMDEKRFIAAVKRRIVRFEAAIRLNAIRAEPEKER